MFLLVFLCSSVQPKHVGNGVLGEVNGNFVQCQNIVNGNFMFVEDLRRLLVQGVRSLHACGRMHMHVLCRTRHSLFPQGSKTCWIRAGHRYLCFDIKDNHGKTLGSRALKFCELKPFSSDRCFEELICKHETTDKSSQLLKIHYECLCYCTPTKLLFGGCTIGECSLLTKATVLRFSINHSRP